MTNDDDDRADPDPEHLRGPWPDGRTLLLREVDAYLAQVRENLDCANLPTRCQPWTVSDITAHLALSLQRFARMVDQARAGDMSAPFPADAIDAENLRAVAEFDGDPNNALAAATTELLDRTTDLDEPVPHQIGPMPAGLQILFGLVDVVLHHDDISDATGARYPIPDDVLETLRPVAVSVFGVEPSTADLSAAVLVGSGRPPL